MTSIRLFGFVIFVALLLCVGACRPGLWPQTGDESAKNAFHESEFAADSTLAASPGQHVLMNLEAAHDQPADANDGDFEPGDLGDTGEEGFDEIVYQIWESTTLGLSVDAAEQAQHHLELYDSSGALRLVADQSGASSPQDMDPGRYTLRIYHEARGQSGITPATLMLRSIPIDEASARRWSGPRANKTGTNGDCTGTACGCDSYGTGKLGVPFGWIVELTSNLSCTTIKGVVVTGRADAYCSAFMQISEGVHDVTFENCTFNKTRLYGTIRNARFVNCKLTGGRLYNFRATGNSEFVDCDFRSDVPIYGTIINGALFDRCNFAGCSFIHRDGPPTYPLGWSGDAGGPASNFKDCTFRNCDFSGTKFAEAVLDNAKPDFFGCKFDAQTSFAGASMRYMDGRGVLTPCGIVKDWNGADLTGSQWSPGSDMTGASLAGCRFVDATLAGTLFANNKQLAGVDFTGADLRSAQFASATLDGARFCNARMCPLDPNADPTQPSASSADFTGASLNGADLSNADLRSVQFVAARLDAARLYRAKLSIFDSAMTDKTRTTALGANFTGASLIGADLAGVDAKAANFENAILDKINAADTETPANLTFTNLKNARLAAAVLGAPSDSGRLPANLSYAYMPNAQLTNGADCRRVQFSYARLYGWLANAQGANLAYADFDHAIVSGMDFSGADLETASFTNAQAVGCRFVGARLTNARFTGAYLLGADFTNAALASANFTNAAMSTGPCDATTACSMCTSSSCKFSDLNPAKLCCYSISERNGQVYAIAFGATVLPNMTGFTCPNASPSPCTDIKLIPMDAGPYPPAPACVPSFDTWCE